MNTELKNELLTEAARKLAAYKASGIKGLYEQGIDRLAAAGKVVGDARSNPCTQRADLWIRIASK